MASLASGDLTVAIADTGRRDEVGEMAQAVLVFRKHMVAEIALRHSANRAVRTSCAEVDRRRSVRHAVDPGCRISLGRRSPRACRICPKVGAGVRGELDVPVGMSGSLTIDGLDGCLPCTVPDAKAGRLHLLVETDAATTARLRQFLARLALPQAT